MINLRKARLAIDITQQELADKVGITRKTLNMYEKGHREPSASVIVKLADQLHVTTDYLLGRNIK